MDTQPVQAPKYQLKEVARNKFVGLILINEIINFQTYFPVKSVGEAIFLDIYLKNLTTNGLLVVKDGKYIPTDKGREYLQNFYNRYYEFLKMFDIFCAVDLDKGEFAFSNIGKDWSDDVWNKYLNEDRFSDVRVAVAEFKGIDPMEIVFMSFLNENRFDCTTDKWERNLTGESVWKEIEDICNTAVSAEYLTTDGVLEDVIKQGTEIAMELIKKADFDKVSDEANEEVTETITEETTEEYVDVVEMPYYGYDYWDPYYDPYYISPLWLVPMVILF